MCLRQRSGRGYRNPTADRRYNRDGLSANRKFRAVIAGLPVIRPEPRICLLNSRFEPRIMCQTRRRTSFVDRFNRHALRSCIGPVEDRR